MNEEVTEDKVTIDLGNYKPMSLEDIVHQVIQHMIKLKHRIDELERQVELLEAKKNENQS